jgi:hypothetical protein
MFGPFTHKEVAARLPFFRSSPLGAVVKGNDSIRPINNLSFPKKSTVFCSVNSYVDKAKFSTTWDNFGVVASYLRSRTRPCKLALFDWEKAYRQIPTAPSQWPYLLTSDFNGRLLLDTRICFGGVAGCGSFGRPAHAWKMIMLREFNFTRIFRWVDDNLFIKEVTNNIDMEQVVALSAELGVVTNVEKYSPFQDEQKFLGFYWNGLNMTVRLPDAKVSERIMQVEEFLVPDATFGYNKVSRGIGRPPEPCGLPVPADEVQSL